MKPGSPIVKSGSFNVKSSSPIVKPGSLILRINKLQILFGILKNIYIIILYN